jgi:hypothetical protein
VYNVLELIINNINEFIKGQGHAVIGVGVGAGAGAGTGVGAGAGVFAVSIVFSTRINTL